MKNLEFPVIGTKVEGLATVFDLTSPGGRKKYFEAKVGDQIKHIKYYLEKNSFVAYFLGKKNAGKGTYTKLFTEIFGEDKVAHVSVGDLVRDVHKNWNKFSKSADYQELKRLYRGYISFDDAVEALMGRSTKTLLPTEFILALLKLHVGKLGGKSLFIDGLPREADQVSYSLYFRDLAGYTEAPDLFILIDIPESVIDERIKYRTVCPLCQTSRNLKLLVTSKIDYDPRKKEFHLICDNPTCREVRMERKEGDELGLAPIRPRLLKDEEIMKTAFNLHGIPKILLRNHVAVSEAAEYFDKYELTPEYVLNWNDKKKKVDVTEKAWTVRDDNGIKSYSLLAPPVMVSLIKQMVEVLEIGI